MKMGLLSLDQGDTIQITMNNKDTYRITVASVIEWEEVQEITIYGTDGSSLTLEEDEIAVVKKDA